MIDYDEVRKAFEVSSIKMVTGTVIAPAISKFYLLDVYNMAPVARFIASKAKKNMGENA